MRAVLFKGHPFFWLFATSMGTLKAKIPFFSKNGSLSFLPHK
ncbi:hypothetical protein SB48_HM08orf00984 [Heyndrickxia coagulans]|uniref:Uncharacterized protein n=1 Tax=Heyndrickxia coagulans TaxID=1398 RepID=A0AAN0WAT6_HEYCO|nr:hypothetical protein SB48_HM08orf00984 [Heyndrickxia coagulans]